MPMSLNAATLTVCTWVRFWSILTLTLAMPPRPLIDGTPGTLAPQAAGEIHGDFEKGFIRAETIAYLDYVAGNGEAGAREAGKLRAEGKSYVVKDGDVLHFLFNA